MLKKLCILCLFVTPVAFTGCGGAKEIPPTTEESGMDQAEMDKYAKESMEKSAQYMTPEQQAMMKKQKEQQNK